MKSIILSFRRRTIFVLLWGAMALGHDASGNGLYADSLRISLITCGPGTDLYTTFGHSAIRVKDYSTGGDYVFNYGTFDFSTPHFYWKFVKGRLMYFLAVQDFRGFLQAYKAENRKVTEQLLNLTAAEKQAIFQFLKHNHLPANRYYKYDFLFDNCSTRIRDIFSKVFGGDHWEIANIIPEKGLKFREIINSYLKDSPWEKLGINLMFGQRADREMTNREIMFLPYFLMQGVGHSSLNNKPLVGQTITLYSPSAHVETRYPFYKRPIFWFSLLALFVLFLSFNKHSSLSRRLLPWIDRCLYFLTGLLGCFLLFMWFGTDHKITAWNFNLLWLLPFNVIFSFYFYKNLKWVRSYAVLVFCINIFLLAGWFILPQQLPIAAIPMIITVSVRTWRVISPRANGRIA